MTCLYTTPSHIQIARSEETHPAAARLDELVTALAAREGMLLRCNFTFPGRYRPHWIGFIDPPIKLALVGDRLVCRALNARGIVLLSAFEAAFRREDVCDLHVGQEEIGGRLATSEALFEILRAVVAIFRTDDPHLGLYGPFGFDMAFHALGLHREMPRAADQADMVLYLPDRIVAADHPDTGNAVIVDYEFTVAGRSTAGLPRTSAAAEPQRESTVPANRRRRYADGVRQAVEACRAGDLFEVVLAQTFRRETAAGPDALFRMLDRVNPSPYEFLANLGSEALVGASPEMFVRVDGRRVESCPISGTVRRGQDAIEDSERALDLLTSPKAAAELTMCTDIDRNDKASLCEPGSVRLLGRRQIEVYSHLLHTVDHVEGVLREDCDAIDAFRAHVWAVTLTGAPRREAITFIETNEESPRRWYGGAIGRLGFDGRLDTGIILRSMRLAAGVAEITVGATILHSSDPEDEEQETLTKAGALFRSLDLAADLRTGSPAAPASPSVPAKPRMPAPRPVIVLGGAPFEQILKTLIAEAGGSPAIHALDQGATDWPEKAAFVLAPDLADTSLAAARLMARELIAAGRPVLGLGHGMVALAEAHGAVTETAAAFRHGDRDLATPTGGQSWLLPSMPDPFPVGCYHRLSLRRDQLPPALRAIALGNHDEVMACEHENRPVAGLLFRPESLLSRHSPAIIRAFLDRAG